MNSRFLIFISIVTGILSASTFYVGSRWIARSPWAANHRGAIWLSLSLFVLLQLFGPYLYRVFPNHLNRLFILEWITYSTLGVFACMFFYVVTADILVTLWKLIFNPANPVDIERRSFLAVGAMALGSAVIGTAQVMSGPKIYEVDVPIEGLPKSFDGFKIAQITDLHIGPTIGKSYAEKVVEMTNALSPDLVALTGDFIDGTVEQLGSSIAVFKNLKSKHGSFFVTGNHEYYWGANEWIEEYKKMGARVLLNEHVTIEQNQEKIILAGVTDISSHEAIPEQTSSPSRAIEGAPLQSIKILLAHNPASYKEAFKAGYHLQLSGHTHGGQFFPWSMAVALAHRYYKGLNRHENMWIYVGRGTGYWGPPLRFGVPSEITLLKLKRA